MFLHSGGEGDHPNQIQHPENIPHQFTNCYPWGVIEGRLGNRIEITPARVGACKKKKET